MLLAVTELPEDMGDEKLTNYHIDLVSFSGNVPIGRYIAELAVAVGTKNSGQRCTAVKRVLCSDLVADEFAALIAEKAAI